jgi:hypothetical protein
MADTVTTDLTYHVSPKDGSKAYFHVNADPKTGVRESNTSHESKRMVIENIRGQEDTVSLDTTGFQYFKKAAKHTRFENDEEIEREYYPESVELIKEMTGATKVVLFDHSTFLFPFNTRTFLYFLGP